MGRCRSCSAFSDEPHRDGCIIERVRVLEAALEEQDRQMGHPDIPAAFAATMRRLIRAALAGTEGKDR